MKKVIYISYAVCAIAMFVLLFYMFDHLRVIESNTREGYTREILLEEPVDKDGTILLCIRRIPARF